MTVTFDFQQSIGMSTDGQLNVKRVTPGGQAEAKGVRLGMHVVSVGGISVSTEGELRVAVKQHRSSRYLQNRAACAVLLR